MMYPLKTRHALLIVFDYQSLRKKCKEHLIDPPSGLLAMDIDLNNAYKIATDHFKIERKNVTVITDIIPNPGKERPWGELNSDGNNPKIIQLMYPEITLIIREIAQFIENTIRGIDDIVSKGRNAVNEVMIYISCHGSRLPSLDGEHMDNSLTFTTRIGDTIERRYLRSNDIFRLLFGHIPIEDSGRMLVSITRRESLLYNSRKSGNYEYFEDEACEFHLTPSSSYVKDSKRKTYQSERGIPINTEMLVMIDSCHSGGMTNFHHFYDPNIKDMKQTKHFNTYFQHPYCVSIAAAQDISEAPSTSLGSPFTQTLYDIFKNYSCGLTIKQIHERIYKLAPRMLLKCKPTITSTFSNPNDIVPFMSDLLPCKVENKRDSVTFYKSF